MKMSLPETIPKVQDLPQGEELDDLPIPLGDQEGIERLEGEVHRDCAGDIPVADHGCADRPVTVKKRKRQNILNDTVQLTN